jgi:hypothetical protein
MPTIETKFLALTAAFRFIVFALLVIGLIVRVSRRAHHTDELVRPVARAIVITALIASQAWWFPLLEDTFRATASYINPAYDDNPTKAVDLLRESATPNPEASSWSWRNLTRSIFHTVTDIVSWIFLQASTLITVPFIFLQYILRWILYFLTPFALGCFMIPALAHMAQRFFQQLFAILAWPIGFALTDVVTIAIWQDFRGVVGFNDVAKSMSAYSPLLNQTGVTIAGLTLLIGTISTPVVCHMLFSQGSALTGASSNPIAIGRGVSEAVTRTVSLATGVGAATSTATGIGAMASKAAAPPSQSTSNTPPGL